MSSGSKADAFIIRFPSSPIYPLDLLNVNCRLSGSILIIIDPIAKRLVVFDVTATVNIYVSCDFKVCGNIFKAFGRKLLDKYSSKRISLTDEVHT